MQYGFVIDHRRCIGCHACTVACKAENDVPVGSFRTWVKYTEIGQFPRVRRHFAVLRCNHCSSAPCVTICPVTALAKRNDGIVDLDKDVCIGCKACMEACPYDALYLNEDTGSAEKCHYCAHRVDVGLEPACVTVCPEQAIVAGDLHDPDSKVARLAALPGAQVRRAEQRTGPNIYYVGSDPVSLKPGSAREPTTWLWSDRRGAPPDWPEDHDYHPHAATTLDVHHPVPWGWKVSCYLVTKGLGAGAGMLAPFLALAFWPEILALAFTSLTTLLLVADLKRPQRFLTILTRPNTRSWLVKGAWVLIGYSLLTGAVLLLRWLGEDGLAAALRWPNVLFAAMTAGYTAFLFRQCEGRDLWQRTGHLLLHLLAQALLLGALALLPLQREPWLAVLAAAMALLHVHLGLADKRGPHATDNARQAAELLDRVPLARALPWRAFALGIALPAAAAALGLGLVLGAAHPSLLVLPVVIAAAGLWCWEHAYVRAAQLPPLS
jgi:Fe-S-cluster-containing dehydrogenase component